MNKTNLSPFKFIGLISILWGGWRLYQNPTDISQFTKLTDEVGFLTALFSIFYYPIFFLIMLLAGIALINLKRWGIILIQGCLIVDILLRLYGFISSWDMLITLAEIKNVAPIKLILPGIIVLLIDSIILYLASFSKIKLSITAENK